MTPAEAAAVGALAHAHKEFGGFVVDSQSEASHHACSSFLACMEAAAQILRLEVVPRAYRSGFSVNYRALFPDSSRHYRVDVLEASMDRHQAIWANGDKFELSPEAIGFAERLQQAMAVLSLLLNRRCAASGPQGDSQGSCATSSSRQRPGRAELSEALLAVDVAWAAFEHKYISNLIGIEDRARQLVVQAVKAEEKLSSMEALQSRSCWAVNAECLEEFRAARRELVQCMGRLNAVANQDRKGRDDLSVIILERAIAIRNLDGKENLVGESFSAVQVLAADIVGSFAAMRDYLREVKVCLERVDPHLCNNAGLVARLVTWEECWEVGGRYIKHAPLLNVLCDVLAYIKDIQRLAPRLAAMCAECDVEVFMVLPRIALLSFLVQPTTERAELLRMMLPHRFLSPRQCGSDSRVTHPELQELADQFRDAACRLAQAARPHFASAALRGRSVDEACISFAQEVLVRRAVAACNEKEQRLHQIPKVDRAKARQIVEGFSRELERWSVELQRNCPQDWNQCSAVLIQCLGGTSKLRKFGKFQV